MLRPVENTSAIIGLCNWTEDKKEIEPLYRLDLAGDDKYCHLRCNEAESVPSYPGEQEPPLLQFDADKQ